MDIDIPTRYGPLKAAFKAPPGVMRLSEFVFNLFPLEERLVGMGVRAAQGEGRSISCRAGCGACCRQPVPVSMPEAFLLFELLAGQPKDRRAVVLARFESAKEVLQANGFDDRSLELSENLEDGKVAALALDYFRLGLPCPFLEAESCSIHSFRPMSCREHLVTSPAALCSIPTERRAAEPSGRAGVRPILAPASLTHALALLYAALENTSTMVFPLPLALDHAAEQREAREKQFESERLFSSFFAILDSLAASRIRPQQ